MRRPPRPAVLTSGLGLVAFAFTACTAGVAPVSLDAVEYQWAEQPSASEWRPTSGAALEPGGEVLWYRVQVPALSQPDPALRIRALFIDRALVCGEALELVGRMPIFPVPCAPTTVLLRGGVDSRLAVPVVVAGSQQQLWARALQADLAPFVVGAMMTLAGLLLLSAGLRSGAERAYRGLGLFLLALGVLTTLNLQLRSVLPLRGTTIFLVHEVATTLYPIGFADFVLGTFGDGPWKVLRRGLWAFGLYAVLEWGFHFAGLVHLNDGREPTALFIVAFLVQAVVLAARARKTDPSAKLFLFGIGALLVVSLPDIANGAGYRLLPFDTVPYAVLAFGVAMVAVVERQHRQAREAAQATAKELAGKLAALEERNREVSSLNRELRHQIAERSKQMADALQQGTAAVSASQALEAGDLVDGRYRVLRLLGRGAMGAVHAVERLSDGRTFALKVLSGSVDAHAGARFAREAEIAARVAHEHLVTVVDVGGAGSGRLYLVMEYVEGRPLEDHRARFGDVAWALELLAQIASGVNALHAAGVVHRDLKPGNVLVTSGPAGRDVVKISDFGISRLGAPSPLADDEAPAPGPPPVLDTLAHDETHRAEPRGAAPGLTATGVLLGTPAYMAPELANGARSAGPASDLFALGLIAWELLTGSSPYPEPPIFAALSGRRLPAVPTLRAEVPVAVAAAVTAALSEQPGARPSAEEFLAAFRPPTAPS